MLVWVNVCKYEAFIVVSTYIPTEHVLSTVEKSRRLIERLFLPVDEVIVITGRQIHHHQQDRVRENCNANQPFPAQFTQSLSPTKRRKRKENAETEVVFSCCLLMFVTFFHGIPDPHHWDP